MPLGTVEMLKRRVQYLTQRAVVVVAGGTAVVEPSTILTSRQVAVVLVGYHWMDMILTIWMEKTTMDMVILSSHGLTQQYKEKW